ncbi:MAG: hypothetical protein ACRDWE_05980, partial [Acidimicrobiales bacterium]
LWCPALAVGEAQLDALQDVADLADAERAGDLAGAVPIGGPEVDLGATIQVPDGRAAVTAVR